LGAAGFGALDLNFDLESPAGGAQPATPFSDSDLAAIARNKLDLAIEYVKLGDIAGARTLISEVIESNDAATQIQARTLLASLAALS
jgi:FimV-like protein